MCGQPGEVKDEDRGNEIRGCRLSKAEAWAAYDVDLNTAPLQARSHQSFRRIWHVSLSQSHLSLLRTWHPPHSDLYAAMAVYGLPFRLQIPFGSYILSSLSSFYIRGRHRFNSQLQLWPTSNWVLGPKGVLLKGYKYLSLLQISFFSSSSSSPFFYQHPFLPSFAPFHTSSQYVLVLSSSVSTSSASAESSLQRVSHPQIHFIWNIIGPPTPRFTPLTRRIDQKSSRSIMTRSIAGAIMPSSSPRSLGEGSHHDTPSTNLTAYSPDDVANVIAGRLKICVIPARGDDTIGSEDGTLS